MDQAPCGTVLKPSDRAAAVEWASGKQATVVNLRGTLDQPVLVRVDGGGPELDAFHLVIKAEAGTKADLVVEHQGQARLAEGVEIDIGDNSQMSTTFIQEWDKGSKHVGNHRIHLGAEASLRHSVVSLGGDVVRLRMDQDFGGEQGDLNMLGIYFVDPGQHMEHRTMVVHNHPNCKSRVVYKGALDGIGAHTTWVGNALIQPTAPGTDSYELNRNLVLTPGAIADSEPNLEIENGDIIGAGHASSVGRFDDEERFLPAVPRHPRAGGPQAGGSGLLRRTGGGDRRPQRLRAPDGGHRPQAGGRRGSRDAARFGGELTCPHWK